jgi:hypothetical protein
MDALSRLGAARALALSLSCAALLGGCAAVRPHPAPVATGDPTALSITAEVALKRGDCKAAAEDYVQAAAVGDVRLARRATEVALACEHLPAAWTAATRWRSLAPADRDADALYVLVALKLYRVADARPAIRDYCRSALAPTPAAPGSVPGAGSSRRSAI